MLVTTQPIYIQADSTTIYDSDTLEKKEWPNENRQKEKAKILDKKLRDTGLKIARTKEEILDGDIYPSFLKRINVDSEDKNSVSVNKSLSDEEEKRIISTQEQRLSSKEPDYSKYPNWKRKGVTETGVPYGSLKLGNAIVSGYMLTNADSRVVFVPKDKRFYIGEIICTISSGKIQKLMKISDDSTKRKQIKLKEGVPSGKLGIEVFTYIARFPKGKDIAIMDIIYVDTLTGLAAIPPELQVSSNKEFKREDFVKNDS